MSFLCSCTRRRKNKGAVDHYYYGKYRKTSSDTPTPTPSVAPTPRVRRKFPGGVGSLSHVSSDVSLQKDEESTCSHNAAGSESDIEDIERTLLSICEQEEERLKNSEILFQLSDDSASDSDSGEQDSASMTSQDLEELLVTAGCLQDSSFSEDSDGSEEPTQRFTLRPRGSLGLRYAEFSDEIWQDIQVSLIEAISSKHSSIRECDIPAEDANLGCEEAEEHNCVPGDASHVPGYTAHVFGDRAHVPGDTAHVFGDRAHVPGDAAHVFGDTAHVFGDTAHVPGDTAHVPGDTAHVPGDTAYVFGNAAHVPGDTAHVPGDTAHVLRAGRFEVRAVPDGSLRHAQGEICFQRNVLGVTFGSRQEN